MIQIILINRCIHQISDPLSALVNRFLQTGVFPDQLKIAKVVPIFKNGNKSSFDHYRPISVFPSFSKTLKTAVLRRVENWLNDNNRIFSSQYGFRAKHSTYMALLDMYSSISRAVDDRNFSLGVFLDLSKAFDTVDHNILCSKLKYYGFHNVELDWFADYLSNRK